MTSEDEFESRDEWVVRVLLGLHDPQCPFSDPETLNQNDLDSKSFQGQGLHYEALSDSSRGCHFCSILFQGIRQVKFGRDEKPDHIVVLAYRDNMDLDTTVWYGDDPYQIEFYTLPSNFMGYKHLSVTY